MFKHALLVAASVFSFSAFAGGSIILNPQSPVVMMSNATLPDGSVLQGPWFEVEFKIQVSEPSTVTGLQLEINGNEGYGMSVDAPFDQPINLNPGDSIDTGVYYVGGLPPNSSMVYPCTVNVVGTTYNGQPISITSSFVTQ